MDLQEKKNWSSLHCQKRDGHDFLDLRDKTSWPSFHPKNPDSDEALAKLIKSAFKFSPQAWGELEGG
ncbi:MAG: hypothetical protein AB1656_15865 [Candidatus Omnitrophota bacterium]